MNWINGDEQEYCDICLAEMKGNKLQFADLEDDELEEELENEQSELCPVCGVNHIAFGEKMCKECLSKSEYEEEEEIDPEKDEEWKNYIDDDTDDLTIDDEELKEELEGEDEDEEEEEMFDDEDEFLDEDVDSLDDIDDEDEDDDEDDDDDDLF